LLPVEVALGKGGGDGENYKQKKGEAEKALFLFYAAIKFHVFLPSHYIILTPISAANDLI
jgi:hypothetical protein